MNELIEFFSNQDVKYKRNVKLSDLSTIGIGGIAKIIASPNTREKLIKTVEYLTDNNIRYKILGRMSNVLPCDFETETVIVSTLDYNKYHFEDNYVFTQSGALFSKIINSAAKLSLGGAESLYCIPGTAGAMLSINAGAFGSQISDFLSDVEIYDVNSREALTFKKDELAFFYRNSEIKKQGFLILNIRFKFIEGQREEIYQGLNNIRKKRAMTQPIGERTLGSVFLKSDEYSASYLIDRCGLKGVAIGDICVSEKHAGFFVNRKNGTANDFLALVDYVKKRVYAQYGVMLKEEFEILN